MQRQPLCRNRTWTRPVPHYLLSVCHVPGPSGGAEQGRGPQAAGKSLTLWWEVLTHREALWDSEGAGNHQLVEVAVPTSCPEPKSDLSVWPHAFQNQEISHVRKIRRSDLTGPTVPHRTSVSWAALGVRHAATSPTAPSACPAQLTGSLAFQVPQTEGLEVQQ